MSFLTDIFQKKNKIINDIATVNEVLKEGYDGQDIDKIAITKENIREIVDILTPSVFDDNFSRNNIINRIVEKIYQHSVNMSDNVDLNLNTIKNIIGEAIKAENKAKIEKATHKANRSSIAILPNTPTILEDISYSFLDRMIFNKIKEDTGTNGITVEEVFANIRLGLYNSFIDESLTLIYDCGLFYHQKISFENWDEFKETSLSKRDGIYAIVLYLLSDRINKRYFFRREWNHNFDTVKDIKYYYGKQLYSKCKEKITLLPDEIRLSILMIISEISYYNDIYTEHLKVLQNFISMDEIHVFNFYKQSLEFSVEHGITHVASFYKLLNMW